MSSLWTPDGEKPVNSQPPADEAPSQEAPSPEQLEELRAQLAETPASIIVANHCFGLFELAALHLSLSPPQLDQAQVAIDALGAVVETLEGRLGEVEPQLMEGVTQLRMAYVQIRQANEMADEEANKNQN
jgi:hypothetical protein